MGKLSKDRRDIYYRKAKENGYRARSSFKLIQINEKFEMLKLFNPKVYIDNENESNEKNKKEVTLDDLIAIYNEHFCFKIVDLCAAPGSWSQVLKNICLFNYFQILNLIKQNKNTEQKEIIYIEDAFIKNFSIHVNNDEILESKIILLEKDLRVKEPKIIAVDLQEMGNMNYVNIIQGDITKMSTINEILNYMKREEGKQKEEKMVEKEEEEEKKKRLQYNYADIIVSDGAPDITGMNDVDEFIQSQLILSSLKVCCSVLKIGGNFVSKIFRGEHTGLLIMHLNNFFDKVYICKPQSSRHRSLEAFLVCLKFTLPLSNIVALSDNHKKKIWGKGKLSQEQLRKIHTRSITKKDYYNKEFDSVSNKDELKDTMTYVKAGEEDDKEEEEEEEEEEEDNEEGEEKEEEGNEIIKEKILNGNNKKKNVTMKGEKEKSENGNGENTEMDIFNFYYSDSDEEIEYFNSEDEEIVNNYIASQNFNNDKLLSFVATQNYYDSDKSYLLPTNYVRCEPQLMPVKPPYLLSLQKKRQKTKNTEKRI